MFFLSLVALIIAAAGSSFFNEPANAPDDDVSYTIRNWDTNDGLPVNAVAGITQDEEGYLWITSYSGISRFDGHEFRIFNSSNLPGIQSNRFHSSIRDSAGNIWFYPEYGGVLRYKDGEFTFYDEDSGFDGRVMTSYPGIINGIAHFPTANGFYKFASGAFEEVYNSNLPDAGSIQHYSHSGEYTVLSTIEGLVILKNGIKQRIITFDDEFERQYSRSAVFNGLIYAISDNKLHIFDLDGNAYDPDEQLAGELRILQLYASGKYLFLSTDNGLFVLTDSDPLRAEWHFDEFRGVLFGLTKDSRNTIWLKAAGGRYYQFYEGRIKRFNPQGMMEEVRLSNLYEDKDGIIWFGSDDKGLLRINESVVETIRVSGTSAPGNILGVYKDSKNRIWSGVRMQGISIRDSEGEVTRLRRFMDRPLHDVNVVAEGPDGSIFFHLLYRGLGRIYPDGRTEIISLGNDRGTTRVTAIQFLGNQIFTATHAGLFIHDLTGRQLKHYGTSDGLASERILNMDLTRDGNVWLTTINGGISFIELSTGRITTYTDADGLALNSARGLYIDRDDPETVWVGTEGNGISRLQNGRITSVNSSAGLFDDQIHSIIEDDFGKLWMSTNRGIFYVRKEQLNAYLDGEREHISSNVFRSNHGMLNEECNGGNANSVFLDDRGRLYYPTQEGIAVLDTTDPRLRRDAKARPKIEALAMQGGLNPLRGSIELPPGSSDFTLEFTAFEYTSPERIQFMYKLEGYDKDWIYAGNRRSATYTNLPPREYRFLLKASTDQFPEDLPYAEATITLLPHFYQQWWFYLLAGFSLIGSVFFLHRLRVYRVENRERKLQQIVYVRTKALKREKDAAMRQQTLIARQADELRRMNQTKDKFFNIIAHDLKGPVSGIKGILNLLDDDYDSLSTEERKEFIGSANKSTEFVYKLLVNLLDWARVQSKHSKPVVCRIDSEKAVYEALNVLKPLADSKKIEIRISLSEAVSVQADRNMLDTILRNFISNAIKFSHPKSKITISVNLQLGKVCFSVKDSGIGMTKEDQKKLFRPDLTMSRPGTSQELGTGLGLLLCIDMAKVLGGHIKVDSALGRGSEFTLCLPVADSETPIAQNGKWEDEMPV